MPRTTALLITNPNTAALNTPARLHQNVAARTALAHTLARLDRVESLDHIILIHPENQHPDPQTIASAKTSLSTVTFNTPDTYHPMRIAARQWAQNAWRGGPGGHTCYDELLICPQTLHAAASSDHADHFLLLAADWILFDPAIADQLIARQQQAPDAMAAVFSQAPPGLAPIALTPKLLQELAENTGSSFARMLAYKPHQPQADPIGKDVCLQLPASVRQIPYRLIFDMPKSATLINALAKSLGQKFNTASATDIASAIDNLDPKTTNTLAIPDQLTLELSTSRTATGPLTPQHHVNLDQPDIDFTAACDILDQAHAAGQTILALGHLGEPLNHPRFHDIVRHAQHAGFLSIALYTDLLIETHHATQLLDLPIDIISPRINADTAQSYQHAMGPADGYPNVLKNIETLLNTRNRRAAENNIPAGLPWIIPRIAKTADNLHAIETFFDRWIHFLGHAVIEPAPTGRSANGTLAPDTSPINMAPPNRKPCRQLTNRLTVLPSGTCALCDQDWLAQQPLAQPGPNAISTAIQNASQIHHNHQQNDYEQTPLCAACNHWHRP